MNKMCSGNGGSGSGSRVVEMYQSLQELCEYELKFCTQTLQWCTAYQSSLPPLPPPLQEE